MRTNNGKILEKDYNVLASIDLKTASYNKGKKELYNYHQRNFKSKRI